VDRPRDPGPDARAPLSRRSARQPTYFGRAQRWLRPPRRLRPTRAGWLFFAITFAVGFAALNTGNNLLYLVLSLMLAFLVLSGVLSEAALRGIAVRRRLPRELSVNRDASVALEIANAQRRFGAFAIVIEDRLVEEARRGERAAGRCFALRIAPGHSEVRAYRLRPTRRGRIAFRGFVVFTRFPFGLFSKSLLLDAPEEAVVYPEIEPLAVPRDFGRARRAGEHASGRAGSGSDVSGLRAYAPGDPLRRIHWRASVRSGALLVRELENDRDAEVEVHLRTAGRTPGDDFERSVRWAASEVAAQLEAGFRVALRTDALHIGADRGPRHRARLLATLALVEPSPAREAAA
jgi:uncharacterized protein (DUF58 family)